MGRAEAELKDKRQEALAKNLEAEAKAVRFIEAQAELPAHAALHASAVVADRAFALVMSELLRHVPEKYLNEKLLSIVSAHALELPHAHARGTRLAPFGNTTYYSHFV